MQIFQPFFSRFPQLFFDVFRLRGSSALNRGGAPSPTQDVWAPEHRVTSAVANDNLHRLAVRTSALNQGSGFVLVSSPT